MILITGATGNLGKSTIDFLLKKGYDSAKIVALVRDEAKASALKELGITIRVGDYDNYPSLLEAFKGIDKLLLVSGSDVVNRGNQHINAINAAKEVGVNHILYTSFERKNDTETSPIAFLAKTHIDTEKAIKESGLKYTIFRNNLYLDALPMFFGEQVLTSGIFLPAGDTKSAFALRNDMAEATANVLMDEGHIGKEYNLSNTINTSIEEIAADLSAITGNPVQYTSPQQEVYVETLTGAGVPAMYIGMFAGFAEAIKQGEFSSETTDLERLLGRKPTSAKDYFSMIYGV